MKGERITYIDAMRGLAMVMVVIHHYFSCITNHENIFATVFNDAIEIPLFFFVSGFFATKLLHESVRTTLKEKFRQLIVPAVLMLILYVWIHQIPLMWVIYNPYKQGYWFTFVLFAFIVIYICSNHLGRWLNLCSTKINIVNIIVGIIVSYIAYLCLSWAKIYRTLNLLSATQYFGYFYFIFGSILFSKRDDIINALNNKRLLIGGSILLYIIMQTTAALYGTKWLGYFAGFYVLTLRTFPLLIIWVLFNKYPSLSTQSKTGRCLTFIGRRSLDVYFIHYFILPGIPTWGAYFNSINAPFVEYLCAIALAVPVIFASLGIGSILRLSPLTSELLLGVKCAKTKQILPSNAES